MSSSSAKIQNLNNNKSWGRGLVLNGYEWSRFIFANKWAEIVDMTNLLSSLIPPPPHSLIATIHSFIRAAPQ